MSDATLESRVAYLERRMAELVGAPEEEAAYQAKWDQVYAQIDDLKGQAKIRKEITAER